MSDKLSINNEMAQLDRKNRDFFNSLTDEERKKFSNFLMIRYGSSVLGDRELQEYYVKACNYYMNKHFFAINKHPQLQWLSATAISPGLGSQRHQWIAPKKKEPGATGFKKQIADLFPNMKHDEIELMATITTKKEIDAYMREQCREK